MAHAAAGRPAGRLLRLRRPRRRSSAARSRAAAVAALGVRRRHLLPGEPEDDDPADGDDRRRRRRSRSPRRPASRPPGTYYVRIDNEVLQVTGGQGTTTWTVARGQLGTAAAHPRSGATVTALATDWYAGFTGVPAGRAEPQGDLQGQELRQHHRHDVHGARPPTCRSRPSRSATGRSPARPAARRRPRPAG